MSGYKIKFFFAWYDLWVGAYFDTKNKAVYICILPTLVIKISKARIVGNSAQESRGI